LWGPGGLSRFEELSGREAARTAIPYAFDLIEHDGEDPRACPFLEREAALAWLLRDPGSGILLSEHVAEDDPTVFAHGCRLGAEGLNGIFLAMHMASPPHNGVANKLRQEVSSYA
jgi:bifunctional non-homologous end joining protein LigD